jgi:hypothetical protein
VNVNMCIICMLHPTFIMFSKTFSLLSIQETQALSQKAAQKGKAPQSPEQKTHQSPQVAMCCKE